MQLTVLMTSDIHGHLLPTNFTERKYQQPFSLARVVSVLDAERQAAQGPVLTIENGDFIQGSPLATYLATQCKDGSQLIEKLNDLQIDAGVLGNHEFNHGQEYLIHTLKKANYPLLAANIVNEKGEPFLGQRYKIFEKSGVKIAVLGLTTQYIPHWENPQHIQGLHFLSAVATAKEWVPKLRQQADVVLVSYHGGFERDVKTGEPTEALTGENEGYQLLQEVPGIDGLLTGHQHRVIAEKIHGIPVVQPGYRGSYVGKLTFDLEKTATGWRVRASEPQVIKTADYPANTAVVASCQTLQDAVETWLDQPLGTVEGDMLIHDPDKTRLVEHPYVEFIQKVQMAASNTNISGTALFNNEGRGFSTKITMRDVVTNYIYPNTLAVLQLTGADLLSALEQTATFFILNKEGQVQINPDFLVPKPEYYNYDMYEGIDYTIDLSQPMGQRITQLTYQGKPLLPEQTIEVVMNQYRAVGGGNYAMFGADKIVREIQIEMPELIRRYLEEHPVLEATTNHNFHVIGYQGTDF